MNKHTPVTAQRRASPVQHICPNEPTGATALMLIMVHMVLMRTMTKIETPTMSISFILLKHIAAFTFINKTRAKQKFKIILHPVRCVHD